MPQLVFRYKKRRSVIKQRLRKKSLSGRKRPTVPVSENLEPEEPVPLALHAPGGTQPAGSHRGACSGHRQPRFQREWLVRRRRRVRPVAGRRSPTTPGNSPEHPAKKSCRKGSSFSIIFLRTSGLQLPNAVSVRTTWSSEA